MRYLLLLALLVSASSTTKPIPEPDLDPVPAEHVTYSIPDRDHLSFSPSIQLKAARGEKVSAFIQTSKCISLNSAITGVTLSTEKALVYKTNKPSYIGARVGDYYDALEPVQQVCPGELAWLDVEVSRTTKPGIYAPFDGLQLEVFNFEVPLKPSMPLYMELQGWNAVKAHKLDDSVQTQGEITKVYTAKYRENRIEPIKEFLTDYPDVNFTQYAEVGASFTDLVLNGAIATPCLAGPKPNTPPSINFLIGIQNRIKAGNLPPLFFYFYDEGQGNARALELAKLYKQYMPGMPLMITQEQTSALLPYVTTFTPVFDQFKQPGRTQIYTQPYWLYGSCMAQGSCNPNKPGTPTGTPGMLIDFPSIHPRAYLWVAYALGASGALYYNGTEMLMTAWTNQFNPDAGGHGDGTLFYPGPNRQAFSSIRAKLLRNASYELEYLYAARLQGIDYVLPVTDAKNWSKNWSDYDSLKTEMGKKLSAY